MLPSMPILFTRDSQDAFGNKIEPSTSFFNQNPLEKPVINTEPFPSKVAVAEESTKLCEREIKEKSNDKKKDQGSDEKPKPNENALETALVRSYYTKVQSRFSSHPTVPTNKFAQFQGILKTFDPSKESPVDLYRKIEKLFGEEHKDIAEEFLLFLKPGQAAEVGRFMDHFMLVQMTSFIELLQTTFARKPTVLRKVLRALTTGINTGSCQEMKNRVLPHLRSNPRLSQMFKSLFPDERPPDSLYEKGVDMLNESCLTNDKGYDVWEFEEADSKRNLEVKQGTDTMYIHGRVFLQHGRLLRTARVTYPYSKEPYRVHARRLAPTPWDLSPPESDDERASPKRHKNTPKIPPKKPKKQLKSPTKNAKDVNDNTNKECVTNSPKTVKKQNIKTKICKDKKEDLKLEIQKKEKKERTDAKSISIIKKEDVKLKQAKVEASNIEINKPEVKGNWTRDEDKTMLQVLKGEAGSEQVFGRISELLPHRSVTEIKERFCHVMNLLQQMAVGEVT
ncbi:uncharacterized protein LOC126374366 [Pectinophora gossypiella]|uniref:uncharacterized protein LOC126374366 n=1 Tax=Pectinophora gossypiella TaxID=13191 RepID=UPI00214E6926|nr:uncharacterized protein LOC126374366 [Pectinophora gossypiella]